MTELVFIQIRADRNECKETITVYHGHERAGSYSIHARGPKSRSIRVNKSTLGEAYIKLLETNIITAHVWCLPSHQSAKTTELRKAVMLALNEAQMNLQRLIINFENSYS